MRRERVQDQYPWTWEIPLAIVCAIVIGWSLLYLLLAFILYMEN